MLMGSHKGIGASNLGNKTFLYAMPVVVIPPLENSWGGGLGDFTAFTASLSYIAFSNYCSAAGKQESARQGAFLDVLQLLARLIAGVLLCGKYKRENA